MPTVPPLAITDAERAERQRRVRAHTSPQRAAKRARMVLLAADGLPNRQVAPMVAGTSTPWPSGGAALRPNAWPAHRPQAAGPPPGCGSWPP
jgi:hypothetical protein